ncbi:MAG: polysaccharide lyase [Cyclobacteriaceae bacterium]
MKKILQCTIWVTVALWFASTFAVGQTCTNGNLVINQNFNQYANNTLYTINRASNDFDGIRAMTSGQIRGLDGNGITWPHKTRIVNGQLRAEYLANTAGGPNGGFLFDKQFTGTEEAIMEYRVRFDKNFIWAYGGKLPGLGGTSLSNNGAIPAGCTQNMNSIENGFSARLMWRQSGEGKPVRLVAYMYLPNRDITKCGENFEIIRDLQKDKWYTIRQHIKLNTPGQNNGILKMYIDGQLELSMNNIMYRKSGKSNVKINAAIMNTYRGGAASDVRWHSPTTDYIYFDDFKVWTNCSGVPTNPNSFAGTYFFKNVATGTYLDSDGTSIKVGPNNGASDKKWTLVQSSNGFYNIDSEFSGRGVIQTEPNRNVTGTTINPVSVQNNREWSVESLGNNTYRFKNRMSDRHYLAVKQGTTDIEWTTGWDGARAQWVLEPVSGARISEALEEEVEINLDNEVNSYINGIYPNPASSYFSINIGVNESANVSIYNMNGHRLLETLITKEQNLIERSENMNPGVYVVKIHTSKGQLYSKKLIIK